MSDKYVPLDRLRPFAETVSATFEVIRLCFKPLMTVMLKVAGPLIVLSAIGTEYTDRESMVNVFLSFMGMAETPETIPTWLIVATLIVDVLASLVASTVAVIYVLEYHRLKRAPTAEEVQQAVQGIWMRAIVGWTAVILLVLLGYVLLIIPGIYLSIALSLAIVVQFAEQATVGEAVSRSRTLVRNDWWWALLFLVLLYCCAAIVSFVASLPGTIILLVETMTKDTASEKIMTIVQALGSAIRVVANVVTTGVTSLFATALVVLYYREVERTEGGGLLERLNAVGSNEVSAPYAEDV